MKRFLAWIDNTSDKTFSRVKWSLTAVSGMLTSAGLSVLLSEV